MACVVLASGLSERFGEADKLSADLCGRSMLSHVLQTVTSAGFGEVFCVSRATSVAGFTWVVNENPQDGQGHALKLGLRAVRDSGWGSCAVVLGDMPLVTECDLKKLVNKSNYYQSVISVNESVRMPPAVFNQAAIDIILSQSSSVGARGFFHFLDLVTVQLDADAALDVDTPEDLTRVARIMEARKI